MWRPLASGCPEATGEGGPSAPGPPVGAPDRRGIRAKDGQNSHFTDGGVGWGAPLELPSSVGSEPRCQGHVLLTRSDVGALGTREPRTRDAEGKLAMGKVGTNPAGGPRRLAVKVVGSTHTASVMPRGQGGPFHEPPRGTFPSANWAVPTPAGPQDQSRAPHRIGALPLATLPGFRPHGAAPTLRS